MDINMDSLSKIKVDPAEVKALAQIQTLVAKIPDEEIKGNFPEAYRASLASGMSDPAAVGMLRFQLVHLMTQAWVNDWMKNYTKRIAAGLAVGTLQAIVGCIAVLVRHDRRLDSLERWRIIAIAALGSLRNMQQRITVLESIPAQLPLNGPVLTAKTTSNNVVEFARYFTSKVIGPYSRTFRIRGTSADGTAVYQSKTVIATHQTATGLIVDGVDTFGLFTSGAAVTVNSIDPTGDAPKISIVLTGQVGSNMDWTITELATDLRPDVASDSPIFKPV